MKNKNVFLRISLIVCALFITCLTFFVPSKIESGVSALEVESEYTFIPIDFVEKSVTYTNSITGNTSTVSLVSLGNSVYRVSVDKLDSLGRANFGSLSLINSFDLLTGHFYAFYFCLFDFYSSTDLIGLKDINGVGFNSIPVGYPGGILGDTYSSAVYKTPLAIGNRSSNTVLSSLSLADVNFITNSNFLDEYYYYDFSLYIADCGTSYPYNIFNQITESQDSFLDGYNSAINKYGNVGYFNQSTFNVYFNGLNSFMFDSYQPVTSSYFTFGDGGIFFTNTGTYDYIIDNIVDQDIGEESGYVSFLKVGLVSDYSKWSYSGMTFGNRVIFIFDDGSSEEFNVADGDLNYGTSYLDLSNHVGKSILEVQVYFANRDSAPEGNKTPIGLGSGTSYSYGFANGYQLGLKDNQSDVYDKGYSAGSSNGYNKGYNEGLATAENTSFFGLISAVIDVPLNFITSIFSFEILGVNISSFLFALLSIAIIITIIKLVSKNE